MILRKGETAADAFKRQMREAEERADEAVFDYRWKMWLAMWQAIGTFIELANITDEKQRTLAICSTIASMTFAMSLMAIAHEAGV